MERRRKKRRCCGKEVEEHVRNDHAEENKQYIHPTTQELPGEVNEDNKFEDEIAKKLDELGLADIPEETLIVYSKYLSRDVKYVEETPTTPEEKEMYKYECPI